MAEKAADAGYPEALTEMGCTYGNGTLGVAKDVRQAIDYFSRAYAAGQGMAPRLMGETYLKQGDAANAVVWLQKAKHDGRAAVMLGDIYSAGLPGIPQDWPRSYAYYVIASAGLYGDERESVAEKRRIVGELMSDAQKIDAQKIFAEMGGLNALRYTAGGGGRATVSGRRNR